MMAYCIAFSYDGVTDVTRRYVRHPQKYALPRTKCPEAVLVHILNEIRGKRRERLGPLDLKRLGKEDNMEEIEFRKYEWQALEAEAKANGRSLARSEEKRPRQSGLCFFADIIRMYSKLTNLLPGSTDWKRRRGEDGISPETVSPLESPDARMMEHDGH
jgi:peptide-N4-(N-acetyl-beta-glucosaminyl)asparagine amidase